MRKATLLIGIAMIVGIPLLVTASVVPRRDTDFVPSNSIAVSVEGKFVNVRYLPVETGYVAYRFAAYTIDDVNDVVTVERYVITGLLGYPGYGEPSNCASIPLDVMHGRPFKIRMRTDSDRMVTVAEVKDGNLVSPIEHS